MTKPISQEDLKTILNKKSHLKLIPGNEHISRQSTVKFNKPLKKNKFINALNYKPEPKFVSYGKSNKCIIIDCPGLAARGKPSLSSSDKWSKKTKTKKYWNYCGKIRSFIKSSIPSGIVEIIIKSYVPMPASWTEEKKKLSLGKISKSKPDFDNIAKGVCDSILMDDSCIGSGSSTKRYCLDKDVRMFIVLNYDGENILTDV